jgi:recombinational DNA repair ATPase RecF
LGSHQRPAILLLDDFMTDFDLFKVQILIKLLIELNIQLIFTVPTLDGFLQKELAGYGATPLKLTI